MNIKKATTKRAKLEPLPKLLKRTEKVFNAYIRKRDEGRGCISCGNTPSHAGHYFNVGQHSALRFDERNVNAQCVSCNCYRHGNLINYRRGLVNKIGAFEVEALEREAIETPVKKWSRTELNEIIEKYKK